MNGVQVLDDYLLDLLAEAVPSNDPESPAAPVGAASAATAQSQVTDTPVGPEAPPATEPDPARIAADLLAEMDADPAFAAAPSPVGAASAATAQSQVTDTPVGPEAPPTTEPDPARIAADLLAEMDADPAFAAASAPKPAAPAALDVDALTASLLAEMDADPAFAASAPATAAAAAAQAIPATASPATKPRSSAPIAPIARRPPPRASRLPANIQAMFQPPPADPSPHRRAAERSTRWLRLRCGEQTYALELLKVQEVVLPVPLLPLRGAGRSILGIMNLRGQVVPVLDLGVHLSATPVTMDTQTRVVVLEENGETMGLRVSAVEDVTSLTEQQIEPPDTTRLCRISNNLFRGVARISSHPVILLDATELLH
ncbi:MAG TPA: chemotaxis protein CheW [Stenotrophomonas sp.]|nr:chemotaxis protein CheW [Stenotrophomonas sp.]